MGRWDEPRFGSPRFGDARFGETRFGAGQASLGGGGASVPAWVKRSGATPATMDLDFVNDLAWNAFEVTTIPAMLACSRASSGYYLKADGTLQNFSSNTLRYGANGLLSEGAATNLLLRSQEFSDASWSKFRCSVTSDQIAAPDGTITADLSEIDTSVTNFHTVENALTVATGASTNYTASIYLKMNTQRFVSVSFTGTLPAQYVVATFDLQLGTNTKTGAGAQGTLASVSIEALANGWFRASVTGRHTGASSYAGVSFASSGNPTYTAFGLDTYTGDGTSSFYTWGAQLELGLFATSYTPTTSSSAARAADAITFSDLTWFDGVNDTIYAKWTARDINNAVVWAFDATNDKTLGEQTGMSARIADATVANTVAAAAEARTASRVAVNDYAISMNGGTVATDVSETAPGTLTASRLGADLAGANFLNSYIERVAAFKGLAANNAALVSLST
jgi:hypothetical protein